LRSYKQTLDEPLGYPKNVHRERQVNVDERIRRFQPFPHQLEPAKTIDDPLVLGEQRCVRLKIFFVRDLDTSGSVLEFVNNRER
jgi:hypothetical protein